jgi:hypothetical protein
MPDFEILGHDTGIERNKLPMIIALGGLAIGLFIFRRSGAVSSPPGGGSQFDNRAALEFARVSGAAEEDMRQLTATNNLRRAELDLAFRNTPAGLRECYTGEQWRALPESARNSIKAQATRGGNLVTAGPGGGVCVVPTERGLAGNLQPVQRGKTGLFQSSQVGVGAPAPAATRPGLLDAFDAYLRAQGAGGV